MTLPPDTTRATRHLKITVSALTRKRPMMLTALLASWGEMDLPENCRVRCLIVENNDRPDSQGLVESSNPLPNGVTLDYVIETTAGIPFGRNRAAKDAIEHGSDLLVFADDDETVAPDWLVRLVDGYRNSDAVLLGAPLRVAPPLDSFNRFERMMHESVSAHYQKKEQRAAHLATLNDTPRVTVVTNNWIAETRLFSEGNLWFDEAMQFTGGTDSKFCAEVKKAGHRVGWIKDAFVYETWSGDRLRFGYHYARARDQINTHFRRKMQEEPMARYGLILRLPVKVVEALVLLIGVPLTGGKTLLKLAQTTGWITGRVGAAFGRRSSLYETTTGE